MEQQNLIFHINEDNFINNFKHNILSFTTHHGNVLMHENTFNNICNKLEYNFNKRKFFDYNLVLTNQIDFVPENTIYLFIQDDLFCDFFSLENITLNIEEHAGSLIFIIYEWLWFGIKNTHGVQKITLSK